MISEPAKLRDFAARYTTAWCSQNAPSVAACYAQDGSLTVNGGTPAVGRKAITEVAHSRGHRNRTTGLFGRDYCASPPHCFLG
jgi:hypothetical protein